MRIVAVSPLGAKRAVFILDEHLGILAASATSLCPAHGIFDSIGLTVVGARMLALVFDFPLVLVIDPKYFSMAMSCSF